MKATNTSDYTIMITGDVASLYTNIIHEGAINVAKLALIRDKDDRVKKFIVGCLRFCLQHNYFWYRINIFYKFLVLQ